MSEDDMDVAGTLQHMKNLDAIDEDDGMTDAEAAEAFQRLRHHMGQDDALLRRTPAIYPAMIQAMKAIGAVGKTQENASQHYQFRGVDDLLNAAQPALSAAGIFVLPTYKEIEWTRDTTQKSVVFVRLQGTFRFICEEDGSFVECVTIGEARDYADKATNKSMSAALKYAIIQVFLVPTAEVAEADKDHIVIDKEPVPETRDQARSALGCLVTQMRSGANSDLSDGDFLLGIGEDLFPGIDPLEMTTEQIWDIREAMRRGDYDLDTGDKVPTETKEEKDA